MKKKNDQAMVFIFII